MKNMSPGRTPSQHNSTLAISPFITRQNRTGLRPVRHEPRGMDTFQAIGSSPLGRKTLAPMTTSSTVPLPQSNATPLPKSNAAILTTTTNASTTDIDVSELSSVERLRLWRHDALMQHMYGTAEYVGNKVYSITGDANDAFWLAQAYYYQGVYPRAISLLTRDRLDEESVMCRYLVASCLYQLQKYDEVLDTIGEANPFAQEQEQGQGQGQEQEEEVPELQNDGGIRIESSLCLLRGQVYAALNNFTRAKQCYTEAVLVDVKNFDAFQRLTDKNLLTPKEEWELLDSLDFSGLGDNETMVRGLYTLCCSTFANKVRVEAARQVLCDEYNLGDNSDVACCDADLLYRECRYNECLTLCERVLARDDLNTKLLPCYIQVLRDLGATNKLFLTAHRLAEAVPHSYITWFAVAAYYTSTKRTPEARKFYSKCLAMNPGFAPGWLGFVHTFSAEGEQDQALAAYATAARFFPGNHLPNMFLGMEYMKLKNYALAEEYFTLAFDTCPQDPLLLNEMGVLYYHRGEYEKSKKYLNRAIEQVRTLSPTAQTTVSIQLNLAHTYRKLGDLDRAIRCFRDTLEHSERNADTYITLGYLYLKTKQLEKAITYLHKALALKPKNSPAQELLLSALEMNVVLAMDREHPLNVTTRVQHSVDAQGSGIAGKKRPSVALYDPKGVAKRVRTNESGRSMGKSKQTTPDDEEMDIE